MIKLELKFEKLEKEVKEDFIEEQKLLAVFLNYYPDVRLKWLAELELTTSELIRIDKIADYYAKQKVEEENRLKPQKKEEIVKIEDAVLRKIYVGKLLKVYGVTRPEKIAEFLIRSEYRDCTILMPEQLQQLEKATFFAEYKKKFPMSFLIFDSENMKIIGIEAVPA